MTYSYKINTFPFENEYNKLYPQIPPTPDQICVIFYPASGGHLIGMLLSCDKQFYGKEHAQRIIEKFDESYDPKTSKTGWMSHHNLVHPSIFIGHPRWFPFDFYLSLNKIVRVQYSAQNDEETKFLKYRLTFLRNSSVLNLPMAETQYFYEHELFKFLDSNNKKYHNIPFGSFLNKTDFVEKINNLFHYFNLELLDTEILKKIHSSWMKENNRQFKKAKTLTEEDQSIRWDDPADNLPN